MVVLNFDLVSNLHLASATIQLYPTSQSGFQSAKTGREQLSAFWN
jgi:hypothetical protein